MGRCSRQDQPKGSSETSGLAALFTLFYYDQRIRIEGYDIERMMDTAALIANAPPPAQDGCAAAGSENSRSAIGPEEGRL